MQIDSTIHHIASEKKASTFLVVVAVLMWVFGAPHVATAETYADSAHGSYSDGVNRSGTPTDPLRYHVGSCAHCHDTFDSDICGNDTYGLMLFASNDNPTATPQSDNFCYE